MLEIVKRALRITTDRLDLEINELIEAAKIDLRISGVVKVDENDALIQQAIKLYCKANFGLDNKDSEKYYNSYSLLKSSLKLCGDYNVE